MTYDMRSNTVQTTEESKSPSRFVSTASSGKASKSGSGAKDGGKMHNVFHIDIYQEGVKVCSIVRRKSEFKQLASSLEKTTTVRGGRRLLTKQEAADIPSLPWFFRPMALF